MTDFASHSKFSFRRILSTYGPKPLVVLGIFVLAAIAAVIFLEATGGPWNKQAVARLAGGKELQVKHWIPYGIGFGCLGFLVIAAVVFATSKWWLRPTVPAFPEVPGPEQTRRRQAVWFFLALLVAAVLSGWMRMPRMDHSFWNDEEMAFREYVWGHTIAEADGKLKTERVTWVESLFDSEKGNNHVLSTIESRIGLALLNEPAKNAPAGVEGFQESAARTGAFVSSCLTILAIGWIGWLLGHPRSAIAVALLLALHPWHMRYSAEIRGYSSHLLWLSVSLGCLIRSLQSGKWRWWGAFAVAQALQVLAFAGGLYIAVAMNGVATLLILRQGQDKWQNFLRLFVANGLSAIPLAVLLTPVAMQTMAYAKSRAGVDLYHPVDFSWIAATWHHLAVGVPSSDAEILGSAGTSVDQMSRHTHWAGGAVRVVLPLLFALGCVALCKRDWKGRLCVGSLALGAGIAMLNAMGTKMALLPPYILSSVLLFCLAVPWSLAWVPSRFASIPFAMVGAFWFLGREPRSLMSQVPRQPIREAVQYSRGESTVPTGNNRATVTATFGQSEGQVKTYDPLAIQLDKKHPGGCAGHLKELMAESDRTGNLLVVYFCGRTRAEKEHADVMALLQNWDDWLLLKRIPGMEERWSYEILRYISAVPEKKTASQN